MLDWHTKRLGQRTTYYATENRRLYEVTEIHGGFLASRYGPDGLNEDFYSVHRLADARAMCEAWAVVYRSESLPERRQEPR